jgi:hypothetical protein
MKIDGKLSSTSEMKESSYSTAYCMKVQVELVRIAASLGRKSCETHEMLLCETEFDRFRAGRFG